MKNIKALWCINLVIALFILIVEWQCASYSAQWERTPHLVMGLRGITSPLSRVPMLLAPAFIPSRSCHSLLAFPNIFKLLYIARKGWQVEEHIIECICPSEPPPDLQGFTLSDRTPSSQQGMGGTVRSSLMSATLAAHLPVICLNLSPAHLIRAMKPEWSAGTMGEKSIC